MSDYKPIHDAANDLLEAAEELGWVVEHYEIENDAYETPTLAVRLVLKDTDDENVDVIDPWKKGEHELVTSTKGLVKQAEKEFDKGAPVDVVIRRAKQLDISDPEGDIEIMKQQGEVYEPTTEHLRVT